MTEVITRRGAIALAAATAATCAVGGVSAAFGGESTLLRPPGGQDEAALRALCVKCDRCRSVCPQGVVVPTSATDGLVQARLPQLNFHKSYCDFCEGQQLCAAVCPTGALVPFDPHTEKIGLAVINPEKCIAFERGCTVCKGSCRYDALLFDELERPYIVDDKCNGCGECVYACNVNVNRTYDGDNSRAVEVEVTR